MTGTLSSPATTGIGELAAALRGEVIGPHQPGYDVARAVHNGSVDRRPTAIARCRDAADVLAAVGYARGSGLAVSVSGGRHNVNGFAVADDALMIDLSAMRGVRVDPTARTVRVDGGATVGDVDHATHDFGLATTGGLALHPVDAVLGGPIFYDFDAAPEVLRFYRDFLRRAPDELGAFAGFHLAPPLPFIPLERHGEPMCLIVTCWSGDHDAGRDAIRPLLELGSLVGHGVGPVPYPALQSSFDALPAGHARTLARRIPHRHHRQCHRRARRTRPGLPTVSSLVHLYPLDGAVGRVAPGATAFGHRGAGYLNLVAAADPEPTRSEANAAWVDDYWAALRADSAGGGYVNFMMDEGPQRIVTAYGWNYPRLAAVKETYDPANLFRINQNIVPGPAVS